MPPPLLLAVAEFLGHGNLKPVYEAAGYQTHVEFSVRKAIAWLRKNRPAAVVADFWFQPDFRDRVSNLESLLATVQPMAGTRVLVYYDPAHQAALDKVGQRFRIDAALPLPIKEVDITATLRAWLPI
jgi:hypothetical protein